MDPHRRISRLCRSHRLPKSLLPLPLHLKTPPVLLPTIHLQIRRHRMVLRPDRKIPLLTVLLPCRYFLLRRQIHQTLVRKFHLPNHAPSTPQALNLTSPIPKIHRL
nr:hypothetical protein Itr_chr11CG10270 [Ipomoea trifida]GMD55429.1 hypothetical protein Iba_chr11dCG7860 [Ipomoea batatas]